MLAKRNMIKLFSFIYFTQMKVIYLGKLVYLGIALKQLIQSEMIDGKIRGEWVKINEVENLPVWEGDKIFLKLIENDSPHFSLKLVYDNDTLVSHKLDF